MGNWEGEDILNELRPQIWICEHKILEGEGKVF